jgi:hypothetical protein
MPKMTSYSQELQETQPHLTTRLSRKQAPRISRAPARHGGEQWRWGGLTFAGRRRQAWGSRILLLWVSLGNRALARELTARIEVTRGGAHEWTGRAAVPETQPAPPRVVSRCAAVVKDEAHHVVVEEEQTRTASPSRKSRPVPRRCPGINVLTASRRCPRRLPPTSPRPQVRSIRPRSRSLVCFFFGPSGWSFFLGRGKGRKVENGRDFFRSQPN